MLRELVPLVNGEGEVAGTLTYLVRIKPKRGKRFFMLDYGTEAMEKLLALKLPGSVLSVFMFALSRVERLNVVALPHIDVGDACKLSQPQVSKAIQRLCEVGVLVLCRDIREYRAYMVNPAFGWNGAPAEYAEGVKRWEARVEVMSTRGRQRKLELVTANA